MRCLYFPVMKTANYLQCLSSCRELLQNPATFTLPTAAFMLFFYVVTSRMSFGLHFAASYCISQSWSVINQVINNYICTIIVSRAGNTRHDGEAFTNVRLTITLRLYPKNQIWMISWCSSRQLNIIYILCFKACLWKIIVNLYSFSCLLVAFSKVKLCNNKVYILHL